MVANPSRFSVLLRALLLAVLCLMFAAPALAVFGDDNSTEARADGTISAINITGNGKTDLNLIYRVMGLQVGDSCTMDDLDDAWDALEDCGYFRFVEIDYDDDDRNNIVLDIELEEDLTTYYGALLRYDRRHKYLVGATLEERNLRGRGETLHVEATALYIQQGLVSWNRPWLFGVDGLETTIGVSGEMADFVYRPFKYRKWDSKLDLHWNFNRDFFVGADVTYGYFQQRNDYTAALPDRGPDGPTGLAFHDAGKTDMLAAIHQRLGYRLALGHLAEETLGASKGADGLQSLIWWKEGRLDEIEQRLKQGAGQ